MDEMDSLAVDFGGEVRELVEVRLVRSPVVTGAPVFGEFFEPRQRETVVPAGVGELVGPAGPGEAVVEVVDIGLGDVDLQVVDRLHPDGRLEISQTVLNRTSPAETLNMRCTLFVPGGQRQRQMVTRLKQGKDRKLYFLPDGASLRGRTLRIRVEQMDGPRVLNYQWKVGENWDKAQ